MSGPLGHPWFGPWSVPRTLSYAAFPPSIGLLGWSSPSLRPSPAFSVVDILPPALCLLVGYASPKLLRCGGPVILPTTPPSPWLFCIVFHRTWGLLHTKSSPFVTTFLDVCVYMACLPHTSLKARVLCVYSPSYTRLLQGARPLIVAHLYICRLNGLITLPWQVCHAHVTGEEPWRYSAAGVRHLVIGQSPREPGSCWLQAFLSLIP